MKKIMLGGGVLNKVKEYKKVFLGLICLIILMAGVFILYKVSNSYAITNKTFTRQKMQDMVVATALSYYYNNLYTDYGQNLKDTNYGFTKATVSGTMAWRNLNVTPEQTTMTNDFFIDCSGFVYIVYKNALGYDFSNYYKNGTYSYFYDGKKYPYYNMSDSNIKNYPDIFYTTKQNQGWFQKEVNNVGLGVDTRYFAAISKQTASNNKTNVSSTTGSYLNNNKNNKTQAVYYFEAEGTTVSAVQKEIAGKSTKVIAELKSILQPGDIINYAFRNKNADGSVSGSPGHVMIYVGGAINKNEQGLIHSYGADYTYNSDGSMKSTGDDTYGIRYDTVEEWFPTKILTETSTQIGYRISVERPINQFCNGTNVCTIPTESDDFSKAVDQNVIDNSVAREKLSRLKIRQYAYEDVKYGTNGRTYNTISDKNSVNEGDEITYNLTIQNKANYSYCSRGAYYTKSACEANKYTWKYATNSASYQYKNLSITNKIPDGTEYVENSCNNCSYDKNSKTITWKVDEIIPNSGMVDNVYSNDNPTYTYKYKVKVTTDKDITNKGMKITTNEGETLQLGELKTKVNPTINGINITKMEEEITKFENLVKNGKITNNGSAITNNYKKDLDNITSTITLSDGEFAKMIYYNSLGIDIGYIRAKSNNENDMLTALFNTKDVTVGTEKKKIYYMKTDTKAANLTGNQKNIREMLVPGLYGGRYLRGNDNGDREKLIRARNNGFSIGIGVNDLEYGDIIFDLTNNTSKIESFMYVGQDSDGYPKFIDFTSAGVKHYDKNSTKTGFTRLYEIYAKDLFWVLRPTRVYGTTVNLEYNGGNVVGNHLVAYKTYKNLPNTTKDAYTTTYSYGKTVSSTYPKSEKSTNTFEGWYSDKNLVNKVSNSSNLISESNHTLYAKYTTSAVTLPNATLTGYTFNGWYKEGTYTTKVKNGGASYTPTSNATLYGKFDANTYTIKYEMNGGINYNGNCPTSGTYDEEIYCSTPIKTVTVKGEENGTGATIGPYYSKSQVFAGWTSNASAGLTSSASKTTGGTRNYYNGLISRALIINDVLTDAEIKENFTNSFNYTTNANQLFYRIFYNGLELNGTSDYFTTSLRNKDFGKKITVVAKFYTKAGTENGGALIDNYSNKNGFEFYVEQNTNAACFQFALNSTDTSQTSVCTGAIPFKEWHTVVATYDGSTMKIYLDGEKVNEKAAVGTIRESSREVIVGAGPSESTLPTYGIWTGDTTTNTYFKNLRDKNGEVTLTANWKPVAVPLQTISKDGNTCVWNSQADGNGTDYTTSYTPTATSPASVTLYAKCNDTTKPVGKITTTNTLKSAKQTATLSCTDTAGVTKYYFGTKSAPTDSDYTSITSSKDYSTTSEVNKAGQYYLFCKDEAGNTSTSVSQIYRSYVVNNMLLKVSGEKGVYTTANYKQESTETYIAPNSTSLTLANIYKVPTHATESTFKGISTGAASETAASVSQTVPSLTADSTYSMWFDRTEYEITVATDGNGSHKVTAQSNKTGVTATTSGTSGNKSLTARSGETITSTATANTGYTFSKFTGLSTSSESPAIVTVGSAGTITSTFIPNTYTITLNSNGATTDAQPGSLQITYNTKVITPSTITIPKKEHTVSGFKTSKESNSDNATVSSTNELTSTATFEGWYTEASSGSLVLSNATSPVLQNNITGYTDTSGNWIRNAATTLYARWQAQKITLPTIEKEGYICGWTEKENGKEITYASGSQYTPTENVTLYGVCETKLNEVKINLNSNGATTDVQPGSLQITYNTKTLNPSSITLPKKEYKIRGFTTSEGNDSDNATVSSTNELTSTATFEGWYTEASSGSLVLSNATSPVLQNNITGYTDENGNWSKFGTTTLYAKWSAMPSVTLPTITKAGYTCGWTEKENGKEITYETGGEYTPTKSITTMYGTCSKNIITNTYTLTLEENGASIENKALICTGESNCEIVLPDITREGYEIIGYASSSTAKEKEYEVGDRIILSSDTTLYAITKKKLTATFKTTNSDLTITKASESCYIYNEETGCNITLPNITATGYEILGFSTTDEDMGILEGNIVTLTQDTTYYARAKKIKEFTAVFIFNGNEERLSCRTTGDSCKIVTPQKTVTDGEFLGWSLTNGGSVDYNVGIEITLTKDITLYGVYKKEEIKPPETSTYTLTLEENGASIENKTLSCTGEGNCEIVLPDITREGYEIIGYASSNTAKEKEYAVGDRITITDNMTLYAITKKKLTAKFETPNNKIKISKASESCYIYNKELACDITLPEVEETNYEIIGFSISSEDEGIKPGSKISITKDEIYKLRIDETVKILTATFIYKNGKEEISCKTTYNSCSVIAPQRSIKNGILLGYSIIENGEVLYKVGEEIKLDSDRIFYAKYKVIEEQNKKKEEIEGTVIEVPDTGSFISIIGIILGLSLVSVGAYEVYNRNKTKK